MSYCIQVLFTNTVDYMASVLSVITTRCLHNSTRDLVLELMMNTNFARVFLHLCSTF